MDSIWKRIKQLVQEEEYFDDPGHALQWMMENKEPVVLTKSKAVFDDTGKWCIPRNGDLIVGFVSPSHDEPFDVSITIGGESIPNLCIKPDNPLTYFFNGQTCFPHIALAFSEIHLRRQYSAADIKLEECDLFVVHALLNEKAIRIEMATSAHVIEGHDAVVAGIFGYTNTPIQRFPDRRIHILPNMETL